jgi:protein SCO1
MEIISCADALRERLAAILSAKNVPTRVRVRRPLTEIVTEPRAVATGSNAHEAEGCQRRVNVRSGRYRSRFCNELLWKRTVSTYLLILASVIAIGCGASRRYGIAGKIVSVDQNKRQLVVSHGEIVGYMPAMVMPFKLKDTSRLGSLVRGDEIAATLVVAGKESWLENVRITRRSAFQPDERDAEIIALPHAGEVVPDFTLINQDGKRISLKQYRGEDLLITFIYTRCPLPDYCPLMSSNFAAIDKALQKEAALYAKTHLLSVSFDFEHDTPAVLRSYGAAYTERYTAERFDHWEFASGSREEVKAITAFFGLRYIENSDQIVHSLVTALVGPDGRVIRLYPYNDWKPADVMQDLRRMSDKL